MKTYKTLLLLTLAFFLVTASSLQAEDNNFSEQEVENLIAGIQSDNNGLMRSSIYFAGKYKVNEATTILVDKLDDESDPANLILIALAIYEIGDREALMKVLDTAKNSENQKVRRMLTSIVIEHLNETNTRFVLR